MFTCDSQLYLVQELSQALLHVFNVQQGKQSQGSISFQLTITLGSHSEPLDLIFLKMQSPYETHGWCLTKRASDSTAGPQELMNEVFLGKGTTGHASCSRVFQLFVSYNPVKSCLPQELGGTLTTLYLTMLEKPWDSECLQVSVPAEEEKRKMSFKHLLILSWSPDISQPREWSEKVTVPAWQLPGVFPLAKNTCYHPSQ